MIVMNVSGNVTADATVRSINGTEVVNFTIASSRKYKTKDGEQKEEVTFVNCSLWNKPDAAQFFYKGRAVNALGFFSSKTYVGADGQMHAGINLRVSFYQLFGKNVKRNDQPQQHENNTAFTTSNQTFNESEPAEVVDDLPF